MKGDFDVKKYKELVKKAIGTRTQKKFAEVAGLSPYNLNYILNKDDVGVPQKSTIKKIAEASEGRVTEAQLLHACGYETGTPPEMKEGMGPEEKNIRLATALKNSIENMSGSAYKYASLGDMLESAALAAGGHYVYFAVDKEEEYGGAGHKNAERYAVVRARWRKAGYDAAMGLLLFYCKTEKGGYIVSDCAFDLNTLLKFEHEEAHRMLFRISEEGDVSYTDYPMVFRCWKHAPGEAERKLLKAIFGDSRETDQEEAKKKD